MREYFWKMVLDAMGNAFFTVALIILVCVCIYGMKEYVKARKEILKYKIGYKQAIQDAIDNIDQLYLEFETDDPFADIPYHKTIIARLNNLKYKSKITNEEIKGE